MPLLLALVAALIQLRGQPLSGGNLKGSATIRLERASGGDTPVLSLRSPAGPVRLLLDSGASSTMVTPELVQRLGLASRPLASQEVELAGGGSLCAALRPRRTRLPDLDLASDDQQGFLRLNAVEALVLPVAALPRGVDGVLGSPSLRQLPVWIDPHRQRLALGDAALAAAQAAPVSPTSPVIPLRWRRGVPLLALQTPAGPVAALADTGAEGLFITPALAARLQPLGPAQSLKLAGFCGEQAVELRTYGGLSLAVPRGLSGQPAAVEAIRLENPIFQQLGVEAIVGQELLRRHSQLWRLDRQPPQLELR
ncbi:MAG: retropepsin-like aspartic protease [Synechococcaceae cyanobacterium ELA739]|jgi:hypothetical protein